ncbi:MAG: hypothetical protein GQ582_10955 [Methyloprofundus sp.]|nr:hypothetical protein [Methyloprofundus sp.]
MLLFKTLILFILFSFNAIAQISKEDVKQVFLDANSGNHKAQNALGGLYYRGDGVRKNHTQAALWYGKSAKEGNIRAIISLGFLYKQGEGVNRDYAKAKALFEQALKKEPNNTRAQIGIGIMYYYGEGVTQDYAKAAEWFKYSADKKDKKGTAWYQSAKLKNERAIKKLNKKAGGNELGNVNAQHALDSSSRVDMYKACLIVETKNAANDGQAKPKIAAHYLCKIVVNDCRDRPNGKQCSQSKQRYRLINADKVSNSTKKETSEYSSIMLGSLKGKNKDTYGISEYNPIMLGFLKSKSDVKFLNSYINGLSGPNGEKIKYRRVAACCAFKTPRGLFEETGVLEIWEVTYNGLSSPTKLYFNVYDYGELAAPVGFLLKK